ncbi:hypothetical protein FRY74_05295 [Vicingus serpentipes]|uniref:Fibronectin type III domain-containing protein n=1 Tax=Vicingus serpentipes TaxID=1926625 RepID=A0A5C6RV57_9FLAO|nr:hypothetical protein [Vicingus serpentipes]TXB65987.1 hypothetical protein FRY74_05295 [Vicingus serpentipes]
MNRLFLVLVSSIFINKIDAQITASYINNRVELSWTHSDIKNVSFYVIEKSKNGKYFKPFLKIETTNKSYSSFIEVDNSPYKHQTYYRLRYINNNGNYYYSETISIRENATKKLPPTLINYNKLNVLVILKNNNGIETYAKLNIKEKNNELVSETLNSKIRSGNYFITASEDDSLLGYKIKIINPDQAETKYLSDTLNIE